MNMLNMRTRPPSTVGKAVRIVRLYPWYHMTASGQKLLIHGADAINHLLLPIGMFSEETQEARKKHLR